MSTWNVTNVTEEPKNLFTLINLNLNSHIMASGYHIEKHFLFLLKEKKSLYESLGFVIGKVLQSLGNLGILVSPWLSSHTNDVSNKQLKVQSFTYVVGDVWLWPNGVDVEGWLLIFMGQAFQKVKISLFRFKQINMY